MFETSSDDLFLPPYHLDMVDNLLSNEDSDPDPGDGDRGVRSSSSFSSSSSLAEALLPLVESSCASSISSSALLAPWVCSTRYKTELCTSYAASGLCRYAERCQFAHGLQELHVPYRHPKYKTEPCRSFHATGCCYYGARCLFVHGAAEQRPACRRGRTRRNVPCRTFRSFGVCPFGTRCNFLHVDELGGGGVGGGGGVEVEESPGGSSSSVEEKSPAGLPSPTLQAPPPPREWRPRGALCRTFSSFGFCLYGTRCRFQHGLPNKIRGSDPDLDPLGPADALPSPFSSSFSPFSSSSSPASSSASTSPPASSSPPDSSSSSVHNAFTFSSRHLNELLLPLALQLQRLESSQALAASAQRIWDNRAL